LLVSAAVLSCSFPFTSGGLLYYRCITSISTHRHKGDVWQWQQRATPTLLYLLKPHTIEDSLRYNRCIPPVSPSITYTCIGANKTTATCAPCAAGRLIKHCISPPHNVNRNRFRVASSPNYHHYRLCIDV